MCSVDQRSLLPPSPELAQSQRRVREGVGLACGALRLPRSDLGDPWERVSPWLMGELPEEVPNAIGRNHVPYMPSGNLR